MAGSKPSTARSRPRLPSSIRSCRLKPLAGVAAGDVDHQPQVRADHAVAGLVVAAADGDGQFVLVVGREQRGLVDLAEVGLQRRLHGRRIGGGVWSWSSAVHGVRRRWCSVSVTDNYRRRLTEFLQLKRATRRTGTECSHGSDSAENNDPAGESRRGRSNKSSPTIRRLADLQFPVGAAVVLRHRRSGRQCNRHRNATVASVLRHLTILPASRSRSTGA